MGRGRCLASPRGPGSLWTRPWGGRAAATVSGVLLDEERLSKRGCPSRGRSRKAYVSVIENLETTKEKSAVVLLLGSYHREHVTGECMCVSVGFCTHGPVCLEVCA